MGCGSFGDGGGGSDGPWRLGGACYHSGMPEFPKRIALKKHKCPTCGDELGTPTVDQAAAVIRVVCRKDACGYTVDLGWLGDLNQNQN